MADAMGAAGRDPARRFLPSLRVRPARTYIRSRLIDCPTELERSTPGMTESEIGHALSQVDRGIETYIGRCRRKIPSFAAGHFSLEQTWRLQRPHLLFDLVCAPVNSAWALPNLAIRRAAEGMEKLGYSRLARWAEFVPPGLKTSYQSEIEHLICRDLLEWDRQRAPASLPQGFLKDLENVPALRTLMDTPELQASHRESARTLGGLLRQLSSGRAIVSDVSSTLLTLSLSWWTRGSASLSLKGIAYDVAKRRAHDRAAGRFFLGRKLGSTFYNVFPPTVHESSVWTILFILAAGLTVGAMACTILSDPIRKMLGFHRKRLEVLLDEVEKELVVLSHRSIKPALRELAARGVLSAPGEHAEAASVLR